MIMKIMKRIIVLLRRKKNEKGSFTIEASLLFPIIFLALVAMIFFSIFVYQKVVLYYIASEVAERVAFHWDNSNKDPYTGAFSIEDRDPLYWRLTDDNILDILFNTNSEYKRTVNLSSDERSLPTADDVPLPTKKLYNIANIIPKGIEGKLTYKNNWIERKVTVELYSPIKLPLFLQTILGNKVTATASATITDPIEFIRNIDFVRKYSNALMDNKDTISEYFKGKKEKKKKK